MLVGNLPKKYNLAGGEGRTQVRSIRVPDEDWERYRKVAEKLDTTVSELIRREMNRLASEVLGE